MFEDIQDTVADLKVHIPVEVADKEESQEGVKDAEVEESLTYRLHRIDILAVGPSTAASALSRVGVDGGVLQ